MTSNVAVDNRAPPQQIQGKSKGDKYFGTERAYGLRRPALHGLRLGATNPEYYSVAPLRDHSTPHVLIKGA